MATPSGYPALLQACPNLQDTIDNQWATGITPMEAAPLAEFLTSAANRRNITQSILPGGGKVRSMNVVYTPRLIESVVKRDQANPKCTADTVIGENVATYTIDPTKNLQVDVLIGIDDAQLSCEDSASYVARRIAHAVAGLDLAVATEITNQAAALVGNWSSHVPSGSGNGEIGAGDLMNVVSTVNNAVNPRAWTAIRNGLDDSGFPGDVLVAGGRCLRDIFQMYQAGCCSTQGIDLGAIFEKFGYAAVYDQRLQKALGNTGEFQVYAPGAVQVLNFHRGGSNPWGTVLSGGRGYNYMMTTVGSPRFGLTYDLNASDNCGTLSVAITATIKAIGLPTNLYVAGDHMHGVTGVVGGKFTDCGANVGSSSGG